MCNSSSPSQWDRCKEAPLLSSNSSSRGFLFSTLLIGNNQSGITSHRIPSSRICWIRSSKLCLMQLLVKDFFFKWLYLNQIFLVISHTYNGPEVSQILNCSVNDIFSVYWTPTRRFLLLLVDKSPSCLNSLNLIAFWNEKHRFRFLPLLTTDFKYVPSSSRGFSSWWYKSTSCLFSRIPLSTSSQPLQLLDSPVTVALFLINRINININRINGRVCDLVKWF